MPPAYFLTAADVVSEEYVNGLIFRYGSSHMMEVYKDRHYYSILEAFEAQMLSAEQVQTVYDNYQKYRLQLREEYA